jgi:hypothetical protein
MRATCRMNTRNYGSFVIKIVYGGRLEVLAITKVSDVKSYVSRTGNWW